MYKRLIAAIIIGFSLSFSYAQNIDKHKLDDYFKALEDSHKFMGSAAISQNGELLYTKAIGYADMETHTRPNKDTKYRIGSISKTFTTVLVFKAIEEKKLSLAESLYEFFPAIKNSHKITIALLLSHRSGIHNFTSNDDYEKWNTTKKSEKELVDIIVKGGSDFEPDSKASYSNSNFVLLSFILQKIYKKEYANILKEKITNPIGLKNTFFGGKINLKDNETNSYRFTTTWKKEAETDMSIPLGAGAIVSTPTDLTKFAEALFGGRLISTKSLAQMETIKDNFGMGLFKFPFNDKTGFGHTGGIDGFSSVYAYYPSDKIAVAITSNGSNYDNNGILITLLNSVYNKPVIIPDFSTIEVSDQDLNQYPGIYTNKEVAAKLTITKSDKLLMIQLNSQPAFPLEAKQKDKFTAERIGAILDFDLPKKQIIVKRGGGTFIFNKE